MDTPTEPAPEQRPAPHPPEVREKAFQIFHKEDLTAEEISERIGVPVETIRKWSAKEKWRERHHDLLQGKKRNVESRARERITKNLNSESALAGVQSIDELLTEVQEMSFGEQQDEYKRQMAAIAALIPKIIASLSPGQLFVAADKIEKLDKICRKALNLEEAQPQLVLHVGVMGAPLPKPANARVIDVPSLPAPEPGDEAVA